MYPYVTLCLTTVGSLLDIFTYNDYASYVVTGNLKQSEARLNIQLRMNYKRNNRLYKRPPN